MCSCTASCRLDKTTSKDSVQFLVSGNHFNTRSKNHTGFTCSVFRKHDVSAKRNATCEQTGHQNVKTTSFEPKLRPNGHIHAAASCRRFFLLSWFPVVRLDYRIFLTCFLSWERFGSEITDRKQKQVSGVSHHVKGNSIFFSSNLVPGATP